MVQAAKLVHFQWLKTFNHQFPIFASCESTLCLSHTFLKFMTWIRKWISSTLACQKCCGLSPEMESSVTHGKNSILIICKQRKHLFCGNHCKIAGCSTPRVSLRVGLPDVLTSAGDASGFPRISSYSSRRENFCS